MQRPLLQGMSRVQRHGLPHSGPRPGGKGTAATMLRNYQKWQEVCINMDTICENAPIDTTFTMFGRTFAAPIFAAPVGA